MSGRKQSWVLLLAGITLGCALGCGSPEWMRSMNDSSAWSGSASRKIEEKKRQEYVETHDRKAMRWLLSHSIESGMKYDEVCKVMGEEGTQESNDRAFKSNGTDYYLDDVMYSWKDNEGRAIYLGFRDGRLVNFDRSEFR
jgi:hypothetical protein